MTEADKKDCSFLKKQQNSLRGLNPQAVIV